MSFFKVLSGENDDDACVSVCVCVSNCVCVCSVQVQGDKTQRLKRKTRVLYLSEFTPLRSRDYIFAPWYIEVCVWACFVFYKLELSRSSVSVGVS